MGNENSNLKRPLPHTKGQPFQDDNCYHVKFHVDGKDRTAIVVVPITSCPQDGRALVFHFHGGGGDAHSHRNYVGSRVEQKSTDYSYITVYPNGSNKLFAEKVLTWNAGEGLCGYAAKHSIDDVNYFLHLLKYLDSHTNIDRRRVYLTGLSNGGMLCYKLISDPRSSKFITAIAPIAGIVDNSIKQPDHPIPIMHFHSVDDPRALFFGGKGHFDHDFPPVEATIAKWAQLNHCHPVPQADHPIQFDLPLKQLRGPSPLVHHTATKLTYVPEDATGAPIIFWKMTGVGHVIPGHDLHMGMIILKLTGPPSQVIDAVDLQTEFFFKFQLQQAPTY